jgi:hypothetical protein
MFTKAGYQEIFAEFVEGTKPSEARWYSVKPLHTGISSLANLLEVSSENLQILLMKAGIGNLGQRDKLFSFQSSKFESFPSEYMLQDACETTRRRVKGLKSKQQWFVRLGTNFQHFRFVQDRHMAIRVQLGKIQGRRQTGQPTTNNHDIFTQSAMMRGR